MLLESNPLQIVPFTQTYRQLKALIDEDLVDLQMSIMDEQEAQDHVVMCRSLLKFKGSSLPSLLIYKIPLTAFSVMFEEATSKRLNSDKYITAVKIYMASNGTGIMPIFQPVYLKQKNFDPATQKYLYQIPSYGNGSYYTFDGNAFVKITNDNDRIVSMLEYTNGNMTLVHKDGDGFKPFIQDTDVESCLFPFQTIYKVMQDSNSEYAFLTNAIRRVNFDMNAPNKHIVIMSGEEVNEIEGAFVELAKFANRSHLCPPCDGLNFGFDLA